MGAGVSSRPHRRAGAALAGVLAAAALLGGCGGAGGSGGASPSQAAQARRGSEFAGAALPPGVRPPRLLLAERDGGQVALGGPSGQVTVAAFLYAGCRACSLIAQQIRGSLDRLPRPVRTLFITVEPSEPAAAVARFLRSVGLAGRVRYLVGPETALRRAWHAYRVTTPAAGLAAFERAAPVVLLDRSGAERVLYQEEQLTPESLIADIGKLQNG